MAIEKIKDLSLDKEELWVVESQEELEELPEYLPFGSEVIMLTNSGLTLKMKNSNGQWVDC